MKKCLFLLTLMLFSTSAFCFDYDLRAICSRPGASELFVGGEFQTILVLNKENGAELRRLQTDFNVLDLQFSQDGKTLIAASSKKVYLLNPETGAVQYELKAQGASLFENAPFFVDVDWIFSKAVTVYSTVDGSQVYKYEPEDSPEAAAFSADFSELIVLSRSKDIKGEKKLIQEKVEDAGGYNVYASAYIKQQADKKGAAFTVIDMDTKAVKLAVDLPYTTSKTYGLSISKYADHYFIAGWDVFLKIDNSGKAYPLQTNEAAFAYAAGNSQDGKMVTVAATKEGFVYNCETNQFIAFNAKVEDEFSYSKDLIADKDVYILNNDYTISVLNEKGMVTKKIAISSENSGQYGVYYTNGYSSKEDRNGEASIINTHLDKLGMAEISLETGTSDDILLGAFKSVKEAQDFAKAIDEAGLSYKVAIAPVKLK